MRRTLIGLVVAGAVLVAGCGGDDDDDGGGESNAAGNGDASTESFWLSANFSAAFVGLPSLSKAAFALGPSTSRVMSSPRSVTSFTQTASRRGVP